jgi:hypothetical protein
MCLSPKLENSIPFCRQNSPCSGSLNIRRKAHGCELQSHFSKLNQHLNLAPGHTFRSARRVAQHEHPAIFDSAHEGLLPKLTFTTLNDIPRICRGAFIPSPQPAGRREKIRLETS